MCFVINSDFPRVPIWLHAGILMLAGDFGLFAAMYCIFTWYVQLNIFCIPSASFQLEIMQDGSSRYQDPHGVSRVETVQLPILGIDLCAFCCFGEPGRRSRYQWRPVSHFLET
jgi:hypothetical protein